MAAKKCAIFGAAIGLCSASAHAASCADPDAKVDCFNCDFDATPDSAFKGSRVQPSSEWGYATPDGWSKVGSGGVVVARNGCSDWGGLNSGSGTTYAGLQTAGVGISRKFTGLDASKVYTLTFLVAHRPDNKFSEMFSVKVNEVYLVQELEPASDFSRHTLHFVPSSNGDATIQLWNESPAAKFVGTDDGAHDQTVFFDNVEVAAAVDCGEGASCHEPVPPRRGYTCRCDNKGYYGHDATAGKATCQQGSADADVDSLTDAVAGAEAGVIELETRLSATDRAAATLGGQVKALADRLDAVERHNQLLIAALKDANVVPPKPPVDSPGGESTIGAEVPAVVADSTTVDFVVEAGRHVTVNSKLMATADEVAEMVQQGINAALAALAAAVE